MVKDQLLAFMKGHFGSDGEGILNTQATTVGVTDIENMSHLQKVDLTEHIMKYCFSSVMSAMKLRMVTAQLYSIMGVAQPQEAGLIL